MQAGTWVSIERMGGHPARQGGRRCNNASSVQPTAPTWLAVPSAAGAPPPPPPLNVGRKLLLSLLLLLEPPSADTLQLQ